jgi:hypothetical protein
MECKLELGAHAVGAGHEHRLAVLLRHLEKRTESADAGEHAVAHRLPGKGLDRVDEGVACVDVHAGIAIRQSLGVRVGFRLIHGEEREGR